jgi:hypothetical protein
MLVVTADQTHKAETKTEECLPNGEKANWGGRGDEIFLFYPQRTKKSYARVIKPENREIR